MVEPRISRTEHVVLALIWLPLGLTVNGLLFWSTRTVAFSPGPLAIGLNVVWVAIMVLLFRRARRDASR